MSKSRFEFLAANRILTIYVIIGFGFMLTLVTQDGFSQQGKKTPGGESKASAKNSGKWLVGKDDTLAFRVKGFIIGKPKGNVKVFATMNGLDRKRPLQPKVDGTRFVLNVPANIPWFSISVFATNEKGDLHAARIIQADEIRSFARRGLTLRLEPATRKIKFQATHQGKPVSNTTIFCRFSSGCRLTKKTDEKGIVSFNCLPRLRLYQVVAWKGTQYVGGYSLSREPRRDPNANDQTIELHATRNQKIALVDTTGNPLSNLRFRLNVAPSANRNYMDTDEVFEVKADGKGVAQVEWFPDLREPEFEVTTENGKWIMVRDQTEFKDGVYRFTLRPAFKRKRISGRLKSSQTDSLGGFNVELASYQAEEKNRIDRPRAFANSDGTFHVDVLPGSTYCFCLNDLEWVSLPKDAILFDPKTGATHSPVIDVIQGEKVKILVTQGAKKLPYAKVRVTVKDRYRFSWIEDGKERTGTNGRRFRGYTDQDGVVELRVAPGNVEIAVQESEWRFESNEQIEAGLGNEFRFHRKVSTAVSVTGKLLPANSNSSVSKTRMDIAAFDGFTKESQSIVSDETGNFEFKTTASTIAIYAYSKDGKAAVYQVIKSLREKIELKMLPTIEYRGKIIGPGEKPLAKLRVNARVNSYMGMEGFPVARQLRGNTIEAMTDSNGDFSLRVPVGVRVVVQMATPNGKKYYLGERFFQPNEKRPLDVMRMGERKRKEISAKQYFESMLKNCKLYDLRMLVIITADQDSLKSFEGTIERSKETDRAILGYLPVYLDVSTKEGQKRYQELLEDYEWSVPKRGELQLAALNADGKIAVEEKIEMKGVDTNERIAKFISRHEPPAKDAKKAFAAALAEAKQTGRVVWAQHSQTRCGPCYQLSRWIDKNRKVLEKDFVFFKVDDVRDKGGVEIARKITGNRHFGIPFVAILDSNGKVLIDGDGPLGNIGFPGSFENAMHFKKMVSQTGKRITSKELDQLVESLTRRK